MKRFGILNVITSAILSIDLILIIVIGVFISRSLNDGANKIDKAAKQDIGNILTGTVELTMSKDMLSLLGEDFDYTLTQEQKDNGFTKIVKNEDGSATYTIKKKDYDEFIAEYKLEVKKVLDELNVDGTFTSIQKIEYTDNFDTITITTDKEQFENGLDGMCIMTCGLSSCMYQMFDVNSNGKCIVEVKDSTTGKVFQTTIYPDVMIEK